MALPANVRVNMSAPFPATVKGGGVLSVVKRNGVWTVALNYGLAQVLQALLDQANTYVLVWNIATGAYATTPISSILTSKVTKVITVAGPYAALPADEVLIIKQAVAAPFTVTVDWSQRTKALRVVDGKGDALVNNITITPSAGQTQMAAVNYSYVIDGNGGSITLTPLPDGTGAY